MANTAPRPVIMWFRQDLRLRDNPALVAAAKTGPVIPLYILDDETPGKWNPGGASRWWLHESLTSLESDLAKRTSKLVLREGNAARVIEDLVVETNAHAVFWNRCYEPHAIARDTAIKTALERRNVEAWSFNAALLAEPWTVKTGNGEPYKVFTPFWRAALAAIEAAKPAQAPKLSAPSAWPRSDKLTAWRLKPTKPNWAKGFDAVWTPGEAGALKRLTAFIDKALARYASGRDRPGEENTSRLSAHLHFGEISPRQIRHAIRTAAEDDLKLENDATKFLSEIGWREFSYHLLYHFPGLPERNFRPNFDAFPWRDDDDAFTAWTHGRTGYPIVDAGMRELWMTGYMHNRVRMIAASFLVKHLLISWRRGAAWFWDTLVDADLANNSASWQWVAGCGADAAPYFRIFNPVLQSEKFDPAGDYIRRWVPELKGCDARSIHRPWQSSDAASRTYAKPIVDHGRARERALAAFARVSGTTA